jgi:lactoylglutathione lyase
MHLMKRMDSEKILVPIADLFEGHLKVADLDRAVAFYQHKVGLPLAHLAPERKAAFFWVGSPGKSMLGLWEGTITPQSRSAHVAFRVELADVHQAPAKLRRAGIVPADLAGRPTDEPVVLAWMPAAAVYFLDPDGNLLEFISMLAETPRPDLGVLPWSAWSRR